MVPNSRPVTKTISSRSQPSASTHVADSYSDNLMDDLFSDVDRILEGDLSGYMTVVGHKPKPINQSARTVTLPDNFVPKSATELYRATMAASQGTHRRTPAHQSAVRPSRSGNSRPPAPPMNPQYGGRPVTSGRPITESPETLESAALATIPTTVEARGNQRDPGLYDAVPTAASASLQTLPNFSYADPMPELTLTQVSPRPPQTIFEPQRRQPQSSSQSVSLPFLLVGAAGISAISTLGLWTLSQSASGNGWLLSLTKEATAAEIPSQSNQAFLDYLQQSLAVISARQAESQQLAAVIPVPQAATLPTTVPNTNAAPQPGALPNIPGADKTPSVIERVFVPVYENKSETKVAAKPAKPVPSVAVPNKGAKPTVPVPAPVAAAAAIPSGAPANPAPSVPIVPVPAPSNSANSTPAPSTPVAAAPTNAAAEITDTTPTSEHVLVGVLNLGSRSAALFDIEGSSQRAYVGDRIGLSSWSLVAVNGQDVVIRRDGEVRSVYIGQRF